MCEDYPCCGHGLEGVACNDTTDYSEKWTRIYSNPDYDPYYDTLDY